MWWIFRKFGRESAVLFGGILLAAAASPLWAGGGRKPRIKFQESQFDFGVLVQGATVQHTFVFKNAGRAPLEIQAVNTSCGCTAALPSERVVRPRKKSSIQVSYDSHGKMGDISKTVIVRSNDPEDPVVHLLVRGLVVPSQHPEITGPQNLLQGTCKSCHVDRGMGKSGEDLYRADCAMCHEHHKMGGRFLAPAAEDLARLSARDLRKTIADGRENTSMPAYHTSRGGPLADKDIDSLVDFIRRAKK